MFSKETAKIHEDLEVIADDKQKNILIKWLARERVERDQEADELIVSKRSFLDFLFIMYFE